jgi:hypothetical protein
MSEQLKQLTRQTFDDLVNQPFQLSLDAQPLSLDLIECKSLRNGQEEDGEREPFSLVFRGPAEPILAQQIHPLAHSSIGSIEIFLVPLGPTKGGMKYEAIFT